MESEPPRRGSSLLMLFSRVVLPHPLEPIKTKNSRSWIVSETPSNTGLSL